MGCVLILNIEYLPDRTAADAVDKYLLRSDGWVHLNLNLRVHVPSFQLPSTVHHTGRF